VGLLGTCILSAFHWHSSHNRNVEYVTYIMTRRTMLVKGQSDSCISQWQQMANLNTLKISHILPRIMSLFA